MPMASTDSCITQKQRLDERFMRVKFSAIRVIFALMLLLAWAGGAWPAGPNLLPNPSFEQGSSMPTGWNTYSYTGTILKRVTDYAHTGIASAYIEVTPQGADTFPQFNYSITNIKAGEKYFASAWIRTENMASAWGASINLEFFNGSTRMPYVEGEQSGGGSTAGWINLTVMGYVPQGATKLMLSLVTHQAGKVWWDDAELVKLADPDSFTGSDVQLSVRPGQTILDRFIGFGAHGDYFLTRNINTLKGVNDADRKLVLDRVAAMRPQIIRVFLDYKWWEPLEGRKTPDSEETRDTLSWLGFLKQTGTDVIIQPWGDYFAYSDWMGPDPNSRLPIPSKRDAMVRSLADYIQFLRSERGLTNVKYVCLMNEPDNDYNRPVDVAEYLRLNALLVTMLSARGLSGVVVLGPDDSSAPVNTYSLWYRNTIPSGHAYFGGMSSHTYRHHDTRLIAPWVQRRLDILRAAEPDQPLKPLHITEFGYGGGTFDNPENGKYEYGLFLADFAISALNAGAASANMWCLFDTYYSFDQRQRWGLWRWKDEGWAPRPGFYSWSLITRYTEPGSRVVPVDVAPAAEFVRSAAMITGDGKMSVLTVNRYDRIINADIKLGLARPGVVRVFAYTQQAVTSATGEMLKPIFSITVPAAGSVSVSLPAESFLLITELSGGIVTEAGREWAYYE